MTQLRVWRVAGKVQGVWFRGATRELALRLRISGHASNLPDGSVRVVARGNAAALDCLARWLHHGPPAARVTALEHEVPGPADSASVPAAPADFEVR